MGSDFACRTDLGDEIRGAETGEKRKKLDGGIGCFQSRPLPTIEFFQTVVPCLAIDIGSQSPDLGIKPRGAKNDHCIDAGQSRQRIGALGRRLHRTRGAFQSAHTFVGVKGHDQGLTQLAGSLQMEKMPRVQQVENAVRQHHALAAIPTRRAPASRFVERKQFGIVEMHSFASLALRPALVNRVSRFTRFFPMKNPLFVCVTWLLLASIAWASKENPVIGLSLDTLKEERWQRDRDTFVAEAKKLGATVLVQSANSDDITQVRNVESLISRGVDVLVIVPHNDSAMSRAIKSANEAKIPVISYDRLIKNADIAYYLSFDNVKVGEAQARYVAERLPPDRPAQIVRIYGAPTDNNAKMFKQGQDNILLPLIKAGRVNVIHEDAALDWKPENAKKIMNAAITKLGRRKIDAVLATNDGTAGGAIQALMEEGIAGQVLVTGQDADLAACQRIMRGTQAMTVYKPLKNLATLAAQVAVDLAKGIKPATTNSIANGTKDVPFIFEKVISVDKNNLLSTVVADGFHRADQLK